MPWGGPDPRDPGVASDITARVGDLLERAEARAREVREHAERSAREARRTARHEAEHIAQEARRAAAAAARERVREISELRASIAARAGTLVEGLEGGELTAARLEELVAALGEAADRVLEEVADADERAARPGAGESAPADAPVAPAEPPLRVPSFRAPFPARAATEVFERQGANGTEPDRVGVAEQAATETGPAPISDPLPEGVPIARKPRRRSNPRFAAVMMAIQGSDREEVAAFLAREHGLDDADELLDDVFGREVERS